MQTSAIVCPQCRRIVAVGAELPASCFGGIPADDRAKLGVASLEADPRVHRDCVVLEVDVTDELSGDAQLTELEHTYEAQLTALAGLANAAKGG